MIYKKKNYIRLLRICEHKSGINSLYEMPNNSILSASSDRLLKIINLLNNCTSYKVEYVFSLHTSSVYKGIKLKNHNILSCGINDYLILWVNNEIKEDKNNNVNSNNNTIDNNNEQNKYRTIKFIEGGQGISDIIETRPDNFVSASDILQFWTFYPENSSDKKDKKHKMDLKENTNNNIIINNNK